MKLFGLVLFAGCLTLTGCGSGGPSNSVENAEQSEVDEYKRLLEESQKETEESYKAAAQEMAPGKE